MRLSLKPDICLRFALLLTLPAICCGCASGRNNAKPPDPVDVYMARKAMVSQQYDLADKASANQEYNLAEEYYLKVIDEYKKLINEHKNINEGWIVDNGSIGKIYNCLARFVYEAQGRYTDAIGAEKKFLELSPGSYTAPSLAELARAYAFLGGLYLAQGKFADALEYVKQTKKYADEKAKTSNAHDSADFPIIVYFPALARYCISQGNYEEAIEKIQARLDLIRRTFSNPVDTMRFKIDLAEAYCYAGDDRAAEKLLGVAVGMNTGFLSSPKDYAKSMTIQGRIDEHLGKNDMALKTYQSTADDLLHSTLKDFPGEYRVERADMWNHAGRVYVKQGKPEDAIKAYHEAMRLRRETATQTHPNYADAIKGLADVAAYKNELTTATLQAQAALKILDTALVPTHPRISPTLVALASIDTLAGHPDQAAPLNARLETILQKPLGPWKEDFMETTAFYAGLLKKAGKSAEATRLDQLSSRQKPRR